MFTPISTTQIQHGVARISQILDWGSTHFTNFRLDKSMQYVKTETCLPTKYTG